MRASCMIITTYSPLSHSKIPVSSIVAPCHSIVAPTENYTQSALKLHLRIHAMRAYHIVRKNWCDNRNFLLFEKKQGEKNGICDIPPRHQAVVGVRGAGQLGGGSFDRCRRRLDDTDEHFVGVDSLSVNSAEVTAMSHALLNVLWL